MYTFTHIFLKQLNIKLKGILLFINAFINFLSGIEQSYLNANYIINLEMV